MTRCSENAFGMRRLNPFNGILQVFLGDSARALSSNGVAWEIQVLSDTPQGLWANMPFGERQFYTFGIWFAAQGLKQVPINPLFNIGDMIDSAQHLIEGLRPALTELPFPLADTFEAWLLEEGSERPLALLASCREDRERMSRELPKWIAAERGDFSFVSPHLSARGLPVHDGYNPRVHASTLESLVRRRAGQNPRIRWYSRHRDGSASACEDPGHRIPAELFPELPITQDWEEAEERALIDDYIAWKAPQLLLLPGLGRDTRARLERLAARQAEAVERLWRLYPEIHDKALLNSTRIEARIRTANRT